MRQCRTIREFLDSGYFYHFLLQSVVVRTKSFCKLLVRSWNDRANAVVYIPLLLVRRAQTNCIRRVNLVLLALPG